MSNVSGEKIYNARKALGLSQEALAKRIGVSKVAVCWYESGDRTPTLDNFLRLVDELNLTLDELVGREVSVVSSGEEPYSVKVAEKDIEIINELKTKKSLYKKLYDDPKRTVELIDRRMK